MRRSGVLVVIIVPVTIFVPMPVRMFLRMVMTVRVGVLEVMRVTMILVPMTLVPMTHAPVRIAAMSRAGVDIHLGRCEPAAHDLPAMKMRAHIERVRGFFESREGNSRVDQRTQQHIAADAGKTFQIADSHRGSIVNGARRYRR